MSIIEINGVDLPAPSNISISRSDINVIGVNELGEELIDSIRSGVLYARLSFAELNNSQFHLILSALDTLILKVNLPLSGGPEIKEMRLDGDISSEMVKGRDGKAYWDVSLNLKEI